LKRITLAALLAIFSQFSAATTPLFSPYPSAKEVKSHHLAGEQSSILTAYLAEMKKGKRATYLEVVGDASHYQYQINNVSSLAVFENYQQAFKQAGFVLRFICSNKECGVKDQQHNDLSDATTYFNAYNFHRKPRYIYAIKEGEDPIHLSLFVGQHKEKTQAFLTVVHQQKTTTNLITANLKAFNQKPNNTISKPPKEDVKKSADHPLLTRYPGSYISRYKQIDYDEISLPVGIKDNKKATLAMLDIVGDITQIKYIAHDVSTLKIFSNYVAALTKEGFEPIFSCHKESCGHTPKKLGDSVSIDRVYNFYRHPRYQIMKNTAAGITTYVAVFVGDYQAKAWTQLTIVRTEPLEQGLITSNSEQIQQQLEQQGKASIYGIFFDHDKATIKAASTAALDEISKVLLKNKQLKLYVVGHTDDKGDSSYNIKLSNRRALAVISALIKDYGIASERLSPHGIGPYAPAATNRTELGRQLNRRVELVQRLAQ